MAKVEVPIWEKVLLTIEEAAAYSGVGQKRIRAMLDDPMCEFVVNVGSKYMVKRKVFEEHLLSERFL